MTRTALLVFGAVSLALVAGCRTADPRLMGTWQSDREATKRYLASELKLSPRLLTRLDQALGKTRITYTPANVILADCALAGTYRYRIVAAEGDELRLRLLGPDGKPGPVSTIRFVGDAAFWSIPGDSPIPGFREQFTRVEAGQGP